MEIIVTGGRKYANKKLVWTKLRDLGATRVIQGEATGADRLAKEYAQWAGIFNEKDCYPADWKDLTQPDARIKNGPYGPYDAQAGNRRNRRMLIENPNATVVAFPGGSGTADCVRAAKKLGMKVIEVKDDQSN